MEKNIIEIDGFKIDGQLIYENDDKYGMFFSLSIRQAEYFYKLFNNQEIIHFNGVFSDKNEFTAFDSNVYNAKIDIQNKKMKYKVDIGKLYLNASNVNEELMVKKIDVKFSSIDQWISNDENKKIFIKQNDCYITISNSFITIEPSLIVTLKQLDEIIFNLRVFFEVLFLNNNVKTIEKFIYTVDDTKIKEVMRYKKELRANEQFLFHYDTNSIESILNRWFGAKNTYGKIFSNLSGILNESSAEYLELKFLMLAQWIEAYSREYLNNTFQTIINERVENSNDNKYRKNLKQLLQIKNIDEIIFGNSSKKKRDALIDQIICYRNHLTHLNIKDDLNDTQMSNLYEILKDMIYILLMKELDVEIDDNRIDEIKRKYMRHKSLEASIQKCKDR